MDLFRSILASGFARYKYYSSYSIKLHKSHIRAGSSHNHISIIIHKHSYVKYVYLLSIFLLIIKRSNYMPFPFVLFFCATMYKTRHYYKTTFSQVRCFQYISKIYVCLLKETEVMNETKIGKMYIIETKKKTLTDSFCFSSALCLYQLFTPLLFFVVSTFIDEFSHHRVVICTK